MHIHFLVGKINLIRMDNKLVTEMDKLVMVMEMVNKLVTDSKLVMEAIKVEMVVVVVTLMDLHLAVVEVVHQEMQTTQFLTTMVVQEKQV